jgi:hypothetical protein
VQKSKKPASKAGFSTAAVSRNAGLMLLRHSSNPEAASHFVYPIRHNSLNRKTSFLLSAFFVTHFVPTCTLLRWITAFCTLITKRKSP